MPIRFFLLFILFSISISSVGETMDDLVRREGLYYKKFTSIPFTGEVTGLDPETTPALVVQGSMNAGLWHGARFHYYPDGQMHTSAVFDNGKLTGPFKYFYPSGRVYSQGVYEDGERTGLWTDYHQSGQKEKKVSFHRGSVLELGISTGGADLCSKKAAM